MRIAILGGGFAGLATAWHLLRLTKASLKIDLFDPSPIGKSVSGLSSGLLHAYSGKTAKKNWQGDKGLASTHNLITQASIGLNRSLILSKGILRPAITDEQKEAFFSCSQENKETEWWDAEKCQAEIKGLTTPHGGLFIPAGLTLNVPAYLEGLWQACVRLGAHKISKAITPAEKFEKYDRVIYALGHAITQFPQFSFLPIESVKGQLLRLQWPVSLPPLPYSLVSQGYLTMSADQKSCLAGSTYEHHFTSSEPDSRHAIAAIMPKILSFFPELRQAKILSCEAGLRATAPQHAHLPVAGNISKKEWFLTGLGSKGLLYHAWLGECLALAVLEDNTAFLPKEILYSPAV